jgi:GTP pyrophosphokinase
MLTTRYGEALQTAWRLHNGQLRKGTKIPYVSHLIAVSSIALEHGANEDEAIAALLHDAVEDAGGKPTLDMIRQRFGPAAADIVEGCTDSDVEPKPPWRARKEAYIAHLASASASVRLVSNSDKLHNARSILSDLRVHGPALWDRFTAPMEGTLWYYRSLVEAFAAHGRSALVDELDLTVQAIERLAANGQAPHEQEARMNEPVTSAGAPEPEAPQKVRKIPYPPEVQAELDEFNRQLGAALVANLNRNVLQDPSETK